LSDRLAKLDINSDRFIETSPFGSTNSVLFCFGGKRVRKVGIVVGFKNPWVSPWVYLGYGSGYRHLYPHKTHTPAMGFKNPWILPWV
jgi:hypothetical protein